MTDNHNCDRALLEELSAVVPQADPAFRNRLETQLLAQLQKQVSYAPEEEVSAMQYISTYPRPALQEADRPLRGVAAPLTLAAALLMVLLAGSALLFMSGPDGGADPFAAAQQTATPAPTTACPPLLNWTEPYIVQPGDTVLGVIVRHGVDARLFLEANCLDANSRLIPGQTVYLPLPVEEPTALVPIPTPIRADAAPPASILAPQIPLPPTLEAGAALAGAAPELLLVTVEATIASPIEVLEMLGEAPPSYVPVVIAAQDIARGTAIAPDMLAVVYWPLDLYQAVVSTAGFESLYSVDAVELYGANAFEQLVGLYASTDIPRFQPVRATDLARP